MVTCEYCGRQADASLGECPSCGAPLPAEPEVIATETAATESESTTVNTGETVAALLGTLAAAEAVRRREPPRHPVAEPMPAARARKEPERHPAPGGHGPAGHPGQAGHPGPGGHPGHR